MVREHAVRVLHTGVYICIHHNISGAGLAKAGPARKLMPLPL